MSNLTFFISNKFNQPVDIIERIVNEIKKSVTTEFPSVEDVLSVIAVESSFSPQAKHKGSYGLMQINKSAHRNKLNRKDILDLETNIKLGVQILQEYFLLTGKNPEGTLLAYNAGIGNYYNKRYNLDYLKKHRKYLSLFK